MTVLDRLRPPATPLRYDLLPTTLAPGIAHDVLFPTGPMPLGSQLVVERFIDGRPAPAIRGWLDAAEGFCARLPALAPGQVVEVEPQIVRSGQVLARLAPKTLVAAATERVATPKPAATIPRYEWASEFLGAFNVQLAKPPESFGPAPDGLHITFYIASGEIRGPKINARIRGEGGDWMIVRRDGVGVADVRITYETDDGALLLSRYYGIFDLGPGGYERALVNQYDPVPPLVLAPQFVTSHPNWLWLNRLQCLAVGRVTMADLFVRFDLYAIRAGQPFVSSGLPRLPDAPLVGDVHGEQ